MAATSENVMNLYQRGREYEDDCEHIVGQHQGVGLETNVVGATLKQDTERMAVALSTKL